MVRCLHREQFQMTSGQRSHRSCRRGPRGLAAGGRLPTTDNCSTPCSTCSGAASRGVPCPKSSAPGRRSMTALPSGAGPASLKMSSGAACTSTKPGTASPSTGKRPTGLMSGRRWGGKDNGPNPTDRAKPGMKDHLLVDGRGVPLSILVTAGQRQREPAARRVDRADGRRPTAADEQGAAALGAGRGLRQRPGTRSGLRAALYRAYHPQRRARREPPSPPWRAGAPLGRRADTRLA